MQKNAIKVHSSITGSIYQKTKTETMNNNRHIYKAP